MTVFIKFSRNMSRDSLADKMQLCKHKNSLYGYPQSLDDTREEQYRIGHNFRGI